MRRNLVLLSVPILLSLGLVTATSASADTVNGGALTNDKLVVAKVTARDQVIEYTFAGTAGTHKTLDISASSWDTGAGQLGIYDASDEALAFCPLESDPTYCEFTPDSTGTWKVKVQPLGALGSVSFKLVGDQDKGLLAPGTSSKATIAVKGQRAVYTFTGTKGKTTVIDVPESNWGVGSASLYIYQPDGVHGDTCSLDDPPTRCELSPPVSGAWKAVIVPTEDSLGSATLMIGADPNQGVLKPGIATPVSITTRATTKSYTFHADKGVGNVIAVLASNWGSGTANLNLYQPDGVHAVICPLGTEAFVCDWTPPVSGDWTVEIAPDDNAVGSATIQLAADQVAVPAVPGAVTSTAITTPGQHAFYTFAAKSGEKRMINVLSSSWSAGGADLFVYQPGTPSVLGLICEMKVGVDCPFNPKVTGTWKVGIFPHENGKGSGSFILVGDDALGTLTPGTPVTVKIPVRGKTASYTFAAANGVHSVFDVTATNWTGKGAKLKLYQPNGDLGIDCPILATALRCHFIPKVTGGDWKIVVEPVGDATGSVTLNLGSDLTKPKLVPLTPVTATFPSRGFQITYPFTATAKVHTTLDVTGSSWTGKADLKVLQPNGTLAVVCPLVSAPTFCDFTPPVGGTWKAVIVPADPATGSATIGNATFALAFDQDKGALAAGSSSESKISVKGQRAFYSFTAAAGKERSVALTANWGTGNATLNLYGPDGKRAAFCTISGSSNCKFTPKAAGGWKLEIAPNGNSLGTTKLTLN